jgi:hypothetical protein
MDQQKKTEPTFKVQFGNYYASLEDGVWKYDPITKAETPTKLNTKPIYKDPVQFKIMEQYEGISKSRYQEQIGKMVVDISKYLMSVQVPQT